MPISGFPEIAFSLKSRFNPTFIPAFIAGEFDNKLKFQFIGFIEVVSRKICEEVNISPGPNEDPNVDPPLKRYILFLYFILDLPE